LSGSVFGQGIRRLCGVVAAETAKQMTALVRVAVRETPTLELRLDWLASDAERRTFLKWLRKQPRKKGAQWIATCRRRVGGGEFAGDAEQELFWLMQAREAGCDWCDLEIETLRELPGRSVQEYPLPERVLLSYHDFQKTPRIAGKLKVPRGAGVDAVKIAGMARTIEDSVRLLRAAQGTRNVVAIAMGEVGLPARILALRDGGGLAYGPVGAATAPGQVSLHELKTLYRAAEINKETRVFGVIGAPVGHSLSPLLHNTGYSAAKQDAVYLPFLVERLGDFLKAASELGVEGFSVTIPHKKAMLQHLDDCEPLAAKIGAVNTVTIRKNGSLYGSNTDYLGVLRALEPKMKLRGSRVVIFGAGGSARAAAFAIAEAGGEALVCARKPSAAAALARAVGGSVIARSALKTTRVDAIINCTPVGMHPHASVSPLQASELHCSLVMDLIYRPLQTKLLRTAASRGIRTVSGADMFVAQGVEQWELWMGRRAPVAAMRQAVLGALKAEATRW
jgi:3-dehydroquinate dehydratase / shikimate dehydrogenase